MATLDPDALICITSITKNSDGDPTNKGVPVEVTLQEFADWIASQTGAGSAVQSVVAGTGISVDSTDPQNPIVSTSA